MGGDLAGDFLRDAPLATHEALDHCGGDTARPAQFWEAARLERVHVQSPRNNGGSTLRSRARRSRLDQTSRPPGLEEGALPGRHTQGETLEEVRANLREAAEGWLAVAPRRRSCPRGN